MKLKKDSLLAKMYRWFYVERILPTNLCPYFWKLVWMWVAIIPHLVLAFPAIVINFLTKGWYFRGADAAWKRAILGVFSYCMLFVAFILLAGLGVFFIKEINPNNFFYSISIFGACIWLCAILMGVIIFVIYLISVISDNRKSKLKQSSIIKEFIKSSYKKYCPKIEWF